MSGSIVIPSAAESRLSVREVIQGLALDAVAVAIVWLAVFAQMTGARLTLVNYGALATGVWVVYLADRLMDGWTGEGNCARHAFVVRHIRWLMPLVALVIAGVVWWMLHDMRWITVQAGMWLGSAVVLYFAMVAASRWQPVSQMLLMGVSVLIILGLLQGGPGAPAAQLWRAVAAGAVITVLYFGMRHTTQPPPWVLVKKSLGGYLFAVGVALGPYSHLQDWPGLLHSPPVLLFAGACMLNSLGIRLWENNPSDKMEFQLLGRLYPWLLSAVGLGSLAQALAADEWSRPVLAGLCFYAAAMAVIHGVRHRFGTWAQASAADGLLFATGLGILILHGYWL